MRSLALAIVLLLALQAAAQGALLKVDITYADGHIISGPLSADLDALPDSVFASFTLNAETAGEYSLPDMAASSLVFGDGAWSAGDLESFSMTIVPVGRGLAVTSLTYAYGPIDTPTVIGRIAKNFPLEIEGTDVASGLAFHYQYDTSSQTVTVIPEPSSIVLAAIGFALLAVAAMARRRLFALGISFSDTGPGTGRDSSVAIQLRN